MSDFLIKQTDEEGSHFDYDPSFTETESFAQKVLLLLNTWSKEFAYDTKKGIDYHSVMQNNYPASSLEAFFLFNLRKQITVFDTFDTYSMDYNRNTGLLKISFIAYSTTGESVEINNFEI